MLVSVINQILQGIDVYEVSRRRRKRRRARMSSEEREAERLDNEHTTIIARDYFEEEAIETDDDCSFCDIAEDGFDDSMFDDRIRDSRGKLFVRLIGKKGRLFRVKSLEFVHLTEERKKEVVRAERLFKRIKIHS